MRFLNILILVLVLTAQYSAGYYRGSRAAIQESKDAIEGWTQCLVDLSHANDTTKEAIALGNEALQMAKDCKR